MSALDPEIIENYRGLHERTGESYDSIARRVETTDPATAAKLREEFGSSKKNGEPDLPVSLEPEGRQAPPKETADQAPKPETTKAPAKKAAAKKTAAKKA